MVYFLVLFLVLSLLQLLLVISFKKPSFFLRIFKLNLKKELIQVSLIIFIFFFYFLVFSKLIVAHRMQLSPLISISHSPVSSHYIQKSVPTTEYEELGYRETKDLQSFYFLYLGRDVSETNIRSVVFGIRRNVCKMYCIVNLYDDRQAYILDMQRLTITANAVMQTWNEKNYIFVADHFLAYAGPLDNDFSYYPFRDWYYKSSKFKH